MRKPKDVIIGEFTLEEIIEKHQHWLREDCEGWQSMRANLANVDLSDTDLSRVNLSDADLNKANLSGANLNDVDLSNAILYNANLRFADLVNINLSYANLCDADLSGANLNDAYLSGADLSYANLKDADLSRANLCDADLSGANLRDTYLRLTNLFNTNLCDADLNGADLTRANLSRAVLSRANLNDSNLSRANLSYCNLAEAIGNFIQYRKGKMLTESIIGYKKCKNDVIITLEIPRGAIVFSINGNKYRTNKAKVIAIDGTDRAYSTKKYMSFYIGDEITIYDFNCEYNIECAEGIHFFMTKEEAETYETHYYNQKVTVASPKFSISFDKHIMIKPDGTEICS